MNTMHSRLRQARLEAGFSSARRAAQRYGWSPSTYGAHENGQNGFDAKTAMEYASAFKVDPGWLAVGGLTPTSTQTTRIVGNIQAVNKIILRTETDIKDGGHLANVEFILPERSEAFEVVNNCLWPRYDARDLIIVKACFEDISFYIFDKSEMIVELDDGRTFIALIEYELDSRIICLRLHNSPDYFRVSGSEVKQAWEILMIIPSDKWSRLETMISVQEIHEKHRLKFGVATNKN